ncbi:MAG TPA: hypothetical protein VEK79_13990 [Thermoanaerobaculia bacterium]|nr:hypothetical protein [Thermoanaerobaculia bacterium]
MKISNATQRNDKDTPLSPGSADQRMFRSDVVPTLTTAMSVPLPFAAPHPAAPWRERMSCAVPDRSPNARASARKGSVGVTVESVGPVILPSRGGPAGRRLKLRERRNRERIP